MADIKRFVTHGQQRLRESGQALVEFALVLPFILVLLFALVDFGRAYYTWLLVTNAAREGARVGATQQDASTINTRIYDSIENLDEAKLQAPVLTNVQGARGEAIEVDLTYQFEFVTPIGEMLQLVGGSSLAEPEIAGHASMRLE